MSCILAIDDEALIRRRVARLLEDAGHEVFTANNGQEGLVKVHDHKPDLILLDFIMPKMNGFQFCSALRAIANYRDTPVVLVSARTDRVGASFIERFDLRDAISKPFEDEALLAVVSNILEDSAPHERSPKTAQGPLRDAFSAEARIAPADPVAEEADRIATLIIAKMPDLQTRREEIIRALIDSMNDGNQAETTESESSWDGASLEPALSGNTSAISLSDVVQLLAMQRQSGLLEVVSNGAAATVQFNRGAVVMAVARDVRPEFLLGRYLVEEEMLTRQDLDLLLSNRTGQKLLGEQLVKLGYITDEELSKALGRQTTDIFLELLRWKRARFFYRPGRQIADAAQTSNRFDVTNLVLEALRQVDEWRLIEREIPSFNSVPTIVPGSLTDTSELSAEEARILALVDGARTVRNIIEAMDMGSFAACNILYRLASVKLIECRDD